MWNFLYTLSVASAQELTVKEMKATNDFERKRKLAAYAMQKGFEGSLVWEVINEICFA